MTRQLTAIMFADMVGYTAMVQEDEQRARALRDRQRDILVRLVEEHGGRILQFYGDGTLSVFPSAIEAVRSAVRAQVALRLEPRVPLRIGVHSGDVVHDEQGVFGDGVNVAARIQSLSTAGAVLVSEKVLDELKNQPDLPTRSLGRFELKHVRQPMEVYAVVAPGLEVPGSEELALHRARGCGSVAVLPFVNMSPDPENEFFSDGVTEEIINALTRVNGLQVTARTSSFAFKDRNEDVRTIAGQLGVRHVLEGSVRRAGDRVRITAQLIDASSGYHLFSESWDRTLEDVFRTQDEIAHEVAHRLEARLAPPGEGPPQALVRGHSHDSEAYAEYLRGRFHWARWTPEGARAAMDHYRRSIAMDPECALPHAALAGAYTFLGAMGQESPREVFPHARRAALRALELEEGVGESHLALAVVKLFFDWDFDGAYHSFQKALSAAPGSAEVHGFYAFYLRAVGDMERALEETVTAARLDPLSLRAQQLLADALLLAGRLDEAEQRSREILDRDPTFRAATETLALVHARRGDLVTAAEMLDRLPRATGQPWTAAGLRGYIRGALGQEDAARRAIALLERRAAEQPGATLWLDHALVRVGLGDTEGVLDYLERAERDRLGSMVFLDVNPFWDPVRREPRFQALRSRVGLAREAVVT